MTSHRAPFPWDMKINGVGVMLVPDPQTGALVSAPKVQPVTNAAPPDYEYSSSPPYNERTFEFKRLVEGMGEKIQVDLAGPASVPKRYRYGLNIDTSIDGLQMLGPEVTTITPASTGTGMWLAEFPSNGTMKLFAGMGRYVLVRNGDLAANWTVSKDLGSSAAYQATRFKFAGATPVDALYVARQDESAFWQYTGATDTTTWTELVAGWGALAAADRKAMAVETLGDEIWRGYDNFVSKATADPAAPASWSGPITVGHGSGVITWLRALGNTLFIFKTDGVYTLNGDGTDNELFPQLRAASTATATDNGRQAAAWFDSLWVPWGDSWYDLGPNTNVQIELRPSGLERVLANDSEVRGNIVCSAGHETFFNYVSLYNAATDTGYLLKYGSWVTNEVDPLARYASAFQSTLSRLAADRFVPGFHGALATFAGDKITAMLVSQIPGPNPRLYLLFRSGKIAWVVLPRGGPNPLSDPNCRYTTQPGQVYWPIHHGGYQADNKAWRGVSAYGPQINAAQYVTVDERPDAGSSWTAVGGQFTANAQRWDFPVGTVGRQIEVRHTLNGGGASTPVVEGMALHEAVRPSLLLERDITVNGRRPQTRRDGQMVRRTPQQIRDLVKAAADTASAVPVVLPDGQAKNLQVVDYTEVLLASKGGSGPEYALSFKAVEFSANTAFGTVDRLGNYLVDDLGSLTVDDLGTL